MTTNSSTASHQTHDSEEGGGGIIVPPGDSITTDDDITTNPTDDLPPPIRCRDRLCCNNYYGPNREANAFAYNAAARGCLLISAIFLSTALLGLAEQEAGCDDLPSSEDCDGRVYGMVPSSLLTIMLSISGFVSACLMPLVGSIVDHTPHRRNVAIGSAVLLVLLNGVQACVGSETWFGVAIIQTISPVIFLIHLVVVYAYLPDLDKDEVVLTRYMGSFVAIRALTMILFLLIVLAVSNALPGLGDKDTVQFDVGTARVSQILVSSSTAILFVLTFWDGLKDKPKLSNVPEGQSVLTAGFRKLIDTSRRIWTDFRDLKWFCLATIFYGAPVSSFVIIFITFTTDHLDMNSTENGVTILLFLLSSSGGSKLMPKFAHRFGLLFSLKAFIFTWTIVIGLTALLVQGPDQKNLMYLFSVLWGLMFGWTVPNSQMVFIELMPKGQEGEMMGLYQFFSRGFLWAPPLIFTILNENGVKMNVSLLVLPAFFVVCLLCLFMMGNFDDAKEHARRMGNNNKLSNASPVERHDTKSVFSENSMEDEGLAAA